MMKWYSSMKILSCFLFVFAWLMPVSSKCIEEEREALLEFKQGIQVDNCAMLKSWSGQECCDWHGILCSNQSGQVISLNLRDPGLIIDRDGYLYNCLNGTVSSSLAKLKHLKYLDLSSNNFSNQPIPSFIGSLVNLEHLNLSGSNFGGEIPHQLANLSSLISLDLSDNDAGIYSNSLGWLSHVTLLRDINLGRVNLSQATDWMQVVNSLPSLRSLHMDFCSLSPSIPSSLSYANSSTTLHFLSLSFNSLNDSSILQWVSNFAFLEYLDLSGNLVSGSILGLIRKMHSLSVLDLSWNRFQGSIPAALGNMHSLLHLDLSFNGFKGLVPSSIFELKHIEYLDISYINLQGIQISNSSGSCRLQTLILSDNNISSDFASIIQALPRCVVNSLVTLDVSNNNFWGSIPYMIGAFSRLETVSFASNSFGGTFSNHHLSNLSRLSYLDLSNNPELVIDIDANWVPPFQLHHISLRSCKSKSPYFPKWLLTQTSLTYIDLSDTGILDAIPPFWNASLHNMNYLNMSNNNILGKLPYAQQTVGTISDVRGDILFESAIVDLSSNCIEGAIPSFPNVGKLLLNDNCFSGSIASFCPKSEAMVSVLDLSNNFLYGELPDCWHAFMKLKFLHLDNNNFTGKLPPSLGSLNTLMYLSMRNNNFNGELQIPLLENDRLRVLDLAYNSFTGDISTFIGSTSNMIQILDLRSNKFIGKLPLSICRLSDLKVLDLSYNQISGTIPECICHLQGMTDISDIDEYSVFSYGDDSLYMYDMIMWKRKEQPFRSTLGLVKYMAISDNLLQGEIPSGISCLKALDSLDLARNNLSGPIPPNIGEMNSLQFLDLSRNHLSGQIPSSLAELNFLGTLDLSYNKLSGKIPTGTQLQSMNATSYVGNPGLCGPPLEDCTGEDHVPNTPKGGNFGPEEEKNDPMIFPGLYISVVLGFIVGFWGVCGTLVIKRSWRRTYSLWVEDMYDKLYVTVVVTIPRLWRRP